MLPLPVRGVTAAAADPGRQRAAAPSRPAAGPPGEPQEVPSMARAWSAIAIATRTSGSETGVPVSSSIRAMR